MIDGLPRGLLKFSRDLVNPTGLKKVLKQATDMMNVRVDPTAFAFSSAGGVAAVDSFGTNPGRLKMSVYVPKEAPRPGAPLIVVLHGCGQNALQFATDSGWTALADRLRLPLLLPEQQSENNQGRCFNWFQPQDVVRGSGEAESIRQMVAETATRFGSDPKRIFVVGLSAGGAMTAAMLAAYPDVFAGGAVVAGLPVGTATDVTSALTRMARGKTETHPETLAERARASGPRGYAGAWPRISIWQGSADHTVEPQNAEHLVAQWTGLHGLNDAPSLDMQLPGGLRHRVWGRLAQPAVELWTIERMGHGFPIAGGHPVDKFVLDVGVPAAEEIARFWDLLPALAPA